MNKRTRLLIVIVLLILAAAAAGWYAQRSLPAAARSERDEVTVAQVNDEPVYQTTLIVLANTLHETQDLRQAEAYQAAFNLIVQNMLFRQLAEKQGLTATDEEVNQRVQVMLEQARQHEALRKNYQTQAAAMGLTWESPAFAAFLRQQWKQALPVEKFNQQLSEQTQGNAQKMRELKVALLNEALSSAVIRLDEAALPEGARNIHLPAAAELPAAKEP